MTADEMVKAVHRELTKHGWPDWALTDNEVRMRFLEILTRAEGPVVIDGDQQRMLIAIAVRELNEKMTPPPRAGART